MSAILKTVFSAINASQFVDAIYSGESNLYVAIGRRNEWAADTVYANASEQNPPVPTNSLKVENDFRNNIIALKRVNITNIIPVVPRVNWTSGVEYNVLNETSTTPYRANNYYVNNRLNYVYKLIEKAGNAGNAQYEPDEFTSGHNKGDGYTWKFLYDVSAYLSNQGLMLDNWLPVPYAFKGGLTYTHMNDDTMAMTGTLTENQIDHAYGVKRSNMELEAYRVMVHVTLDDTENDAIPEDISFRQVGLILDPQLQTTPAGAGATMLGDFISDGKFTAGDIITPTSTDPNTAYDKRTGQILYLENRKPIHRVSGQSEQIEIIVSF
jgi:hypothetical protein